MKKRKYRFFYHYNKQLGKMSVHYKNRCFIVDNVDCYAPAFSKYNKRQPKLVMQGFAKEVVITTQPLTAIIYE